LLPTGRGEPEQKKVRRDKDPISDRKRQGRKKQKREKYSTRYMGSVESRKKIARPPAFLSRGWHRGHFAAKQNWERQASELGERSRWELLVMTMSIPMIVGMVYPMRREKARLATPGKKKEGSVGGEGL